MNWNRVYRPSRISDLHLASVKEQLQQMLKVGYFPQAMLFSGPKGTGKTTAARIIAAILNDPKNLSLVTKIYRERKTPTATESLFDLSEISEDQATILTGRSFLVRELDAASNRGIDDIRQLKESAFTPPPVGVMSVYILDEAHMLTTEAWNALLKLLEEPPQHVLFILATTELHKIPATIRSRCREIFFSVASSSEIASALGRIVKLEKLELDSKTLTKIAEASLGSFRDAIKLLEQVANSDKSGDAAVSILVGQQTQADFIQLLEIILAKDVQKLLQFFSSLRQCNSDDTAFLKSFLSFLHNLLLASYTSDSKQIANETVLRYLLTQLQNCISSASPLPHLSLELALLNMIVKSSTQKEAVTTSSPPKVPAKKVEITPSVQTKPHTGDAKQACDRWDEILSSCTKRNFGLATLLRSAKAISLTKTSLEIQVYYDFHKEQLQQPKFYVALCEVIEQISGGSIQLSISTMTPPSDAELLEVGQTPLKELAVAALM